MKKNRLGNTSKRRLNTCHIDLVVIFSEAIVYSPIDFSIVQGERSEEQQLAYFLDGKSKLDPRNTEELKKAKHVTGKFRANSEAVDIALYVPNKKLAYHKESLILVAGHILATAKRLYLDGVVKHQLRWGGNWDGDEEVVTDQTFNDLVHFELVSVNKE